MKDAPQTQKITTITTRSAAETVALGRALGKALQTGDAILLSGELGAGKTALAQGVAAGANYGGLARSPSFVLINEYDSDPKIAHCDLYRLEQAEVGELGLLDYLDRAALVVEWHERAAELAELDALMMELSYGAGEDDRIIRLSHTGPRGRALRDALAAQTGGGG